jgi:hypothetical protein
MSDAEHDLDALLRSAAPVRPDTTAEDRVYADVWARLGTAMDDGVPDDARQQRRLDLIVDREVSARRRRRAARLASATLAVVLAGGGTAAAAVEYLSTHTGQELTGWEIEAGGSGEVLNLGGTDRDQVFDEVTADIPFAPGYAAARRYALDFYPREADSTISTEYLRSWVAGNAVCTWADAWVAADTAGDAEARSAAAAELAETVSWPDIVEADVPDATITETGEHLSYRWWVRPLAEAAAAGHRAAVLDTVAHSATCSYQVIPTIDAAADYEYAGVR